MSNTQQITSTVEATESGFTGYATVSQVTMIDGNGRAALGLTENDGSFSGQVTASIEASPAVFQIGLWALLNNDSIIWLQTDGNRNIITLGANKS